MPKLLLNEIEEITRGIKRFDKPLKRKCRIKTILQIKQKNKICQNFRVNLVFSYNHLTTNPEDYKLILFHDLSKI